MPLLLSCIIALTAAACDPKPADPSFQIAEVRAGLESPTGFQFANDGSLFIAERAGVIRKYRGVSDPAPVVVVDLSRDVNVTWDRGLLGLEIDPKFTEGRPYLYALYSYDAPPGGVAPTYGDVCPGFGNDGTCVTTGQLERITVGSNGVATERKALVHDWCQQFGSHSVGDVQMGPEGALYVSAGDGASFEAADTGQFGNPCGDPVTEGGALRAQDVHSPGDPTTLDGAVIRIDPDTGLAWPSNPWASSPDVSRARIIAYGFRNPFRLTLSPDGKKLVVSDVGWNTYEEVNVMRTDEPAPVNFGWPCYEGPEAQPLYMQASPICAATPATAVRAPEMAYSHTSNLGEGCNEGGSSITGVAYSQPGSYPASFSGGLFTADYSRKCIWFTPADANGTLLHSKRSVFVTNAYVVDIQVGPGGDLFYVDLLGGRLMRVSFKANRPPMPVINAGTTSATRGQWVSLNWWGTSDPDNDFALQYAWDLQGDGAFDDGGDLFSGVAFDTVGPHAIRLRVTDSAGATAISSVTIQVENSAPVPIIDAPQITSATPGTTVAFGGHATDAEDGTIPASGLHWEFRLQHCTVSFGCHAHPVNSINGVSSGSFVMPQHEKPSHVEIILTATDKNGSSASTTRNVEVS